MIAFANRRRNGTRGSVYLHTRRLSRRLTCASPESRQQKEREDSDDIVEHERRFFIVPDLLATPGVINLRVITDDYYAIVPEGTDPTSSELRRAYIQYVIDALVLRNNKAIAARREQVKQLIDARTKEGGTISLDAFVVVTRSLVAGADAALRKQIAGPTWMRPTRAIGSRERRC